MFDYVTERPTDTVFNGTYKYHTKLTIFGLSLRYWTKVSLTTSCGIGSFSPFFSCSDKAWNKQFPLPSLSETMKPMSDTALLKYSSFCWSVGNPLLLTLLSLIASFNFARFLVVSPRTPKGNRHLCCKK